MLELDQPPTAFIVASVISAIGVRRASYEKGLVLGQDLSVVTYDDDLSYLSNREDVPIFTALRSSVRHAGGHVTTLLLDQIEHRPKTPATRLLEAELVVGTSTGPNHI